MFSHIYLHHVYLHVVNLCTLSHLLLIAILCNTVDVCVSLCSVRVCECVCVVCACVHVSMCVSVCVCDVTDADLLGHFLMGVKP